MNKKNNEIQNDNPMDDENQSNEELNENNSPEGETAKAEQYLANWQRTQADFANYKKRMQQEKTESAKFANSMLMLGILPAIDDLERALENVSPEMKDLNWVEGISHISRKLISVLESFNLKKIDSIGQDFDPNFHQAVMHEKGEEGKVIEELQKGYMLNDRLLRPAMVKVGKADVD